QHLEDPLQRLEQETDSRTRQRPMLEHELAGFAARTAGSIGVHTSSHAALPFLADPEGMAGIQEGYRALRERFWKARSCPAIPFGLLPQTTLKLARRAGMTAMLTLAGSPLVAGASSPDTIPRLCLVREQSPGKTALKASRLGALLNRMRNREPEFPVLP